MPDDRPPADVSAAADALAEAEALASAGQRMRAIAVLHQANLAHPDPDVECRLATLRNEAFTELEPASAFDRWPVATATDPDEPPHIPDLAPEDLSGDAVRRAIASHGSVRVPGLLDAVQIQAFVDGIDHVLELREANQATPYRRFSSWFAGLPLPPEDAALLGRAWIAGAGGVLSCDSPKLLELLLSTYEEVGLRRVLTEYLGERPVLSANKCTLRRVPTTANTDWHQDGAFLGTGIRALNVWVALTDCGEDAPGMDLVPRRFEEIVPTGTGGAIFDWAVGPDVVATLAVDAPVVRPRFRAGDALLFDDLFLHRTGVDPAMTETRYALESWFFAKTDYPAGQVPLVW